jgi:hypothetical protein
MANIGDVNQDGIPDFVVGAYNHAVNHNEYQVQGAGHHVVDAKEMRIRNQGMAFVFSGKDGKVIHVVNNPDPGSFDASLYTQTGVAFGCSVAGVGDVSGDGVPDFLIGAFNHARRGEAFIFSGADSSLLMTLSDPSLGNEALFGWAVAGMGDMNGDGVSELLVSAPGKEQALVFNGSNGEELLSVRNPMVRGAFGWAVAGVGDVNKDGVPDLLIGAPYQDVKSNGNQEVDLQPQDLFSSAPEQAVSKYKEYGVQGQAFVFSGSNGELLFTLDDPIPGAGSAFGWVVSEAGDVNRDGTPDFLVSAPYQDVNGNRSQGHVFTFSGADGKLLYTLTTPAPHAYAGFGLFVGSAGDVNGDNAPEIMAGAPFQKVDAYGLQGQLFIFNGLDGRHLFTFNDPYPQQGAFFGTTAISPGDLDGDSIPEFVVGAPGQPLRHLPTVGRAFVFTSAQ